MTTTSFRLTGLKPGWPIVYRVGHLGDPPASFSAPVRHAGALPGPETDTVNILYVADMGVGPVRPDELV